jgi:hypothetical protein
MIRVRKKITVIFLQPSNPALWRGNGARRDETSPRSVQIGGRCADQDDAEHTMKYWGAR